MVSCSIVGLVTWKVPGGYNRVEEGGGLERCLVGFDSMTPSEARAVLKSTVANPPMSWGSEARHFAGPALTR